VIPERIVPIADAPDQTCGECDWWQRSIIPDRGFCALHELRADITDPACESWWKPEADI
jgi:hypothetical protein